MRERFFRLAGANRAATDVSEPRPRGSGFCHMKIFLLFVVRVVVIATIATCVFALIRIASV